MNTIKRV